jgi:hypothetical protein
VSSISFHRIIGRRVFDRDGRAVGRLEEAPVVREGEDLVVPEFHIGAAAILERLAATLSPLPLPSGRGWVARWDQLDWSDPERLRLNCGLEDLRRFTRHPSPRRPRGEKR